MTGTGAVRARAPGSGAPRNARRRVRIGVAAAIMVAACAGPSPHGAAPVPQPQASAPPAPAPADFCPDSPDVSTHGGAPSTDLYCIELIATPALMDSAWGVVRLTPPPSPFGAAVTRDGHHRFNTTFTIRGLPEPSSLGAFTTFVAWAAPPGMWPLVRLGTVRNGRVDAGELALNKYYVLVSAETSDTVSERRGPLLLRGLSASTRMRDPHFMMMSPPAAAADEHAHHAAGGWTMPPHDPRVSDTPMGIEHLAPPVTPFLPGAGIESSSIPLARPRELLRVSDGDSIRLTAQLVRRSIKGRDVVMYGFNGQYPGPLIHVTQAATIVVEFRNETVHETAVHWHGIRLDNRFDGVPHVTQEPVPPGGTFRYVIHFPDAGIYWYHPHHREDIQQDLGLYGNLMVTSTDPDYYGPAHRDEVLMLDDILAGDDGLVPYGLEAANFAVMGRFGNVLLVNGEPSYALDVRRGEVVRFHLTNASNTRTFNLAFDNARMKVVASDVGRFEREEWVESVVLAPAERYVVEVRFDAEGTSTLTNRVQAIDHMMGAFVPMVDTLGSVSVRAERAVPDLAASFDRLRTNATVSAEVDRYRAHFARPADYELALELRPDSLPFALTQVMRLDSLYFNPVEWAGTMPMMDWLPTTQQVRWVLRDPRTGAENNAIDWRFRVGDVVRIRLGNQRHSLHAMQHPIHIHGQRFLVLSVNGVPADNHAWKDTVLVPVGMSVELLLELSNPGRWMLHCHIAEHLEAGMQFVFHVDGT
ncbi:MAG TPA: multicopper oxidase family protein [Longimicrobiales bacterium]|nr:multicopper oxidase family protein [Longimicrobiales bacterium]